MAEVNLRRATFDAPGALHPLGGVHHDVHQEDQREDPQDAAADRDLRKEEHHSDDEKENYESVQHAENGTPPTV